MNERASLPAAVLSYTSNVDLVTESQANRVDGSIWEDYRKMFYKVKPESQK